MWQSIISNPECMCHALDIQRTLWALCKLHVLNELMKSRCHNAAWDLWNRSILNIKTGPPLDQDVGYVYLKTQNPVLCRCIYMTQNTFLHPLYIWYYILPLTFRTTTIISAAAAAAFLQNTHSEVFDTAILHSHGLLIAITSFIILTSSLRCPLPLPQLLPLSHNHFHHCHNI